MLVKELQPENASSPIDVTESGRSMLVRREPQPKNADEPIDVTEDGIVEEQLFV